MSKTMEIEAPARPIGVYTRPKGNTGWRDWITTVDQFGPDEFGYHIRFLKYLN